MNDRTRSRCHTFVTILGTTRTHRWKLWMCPCAQFRHPSPKAGSCPWERPSKGPSETCVNEAVITRKEPECTTSKSVTTITSMMSECQSRGPCSTRDARTASLCRSTVVVCLWWATVEVAISGMINVVVVVHRIRIHRTIKGLTATISWRRARSLWRLMLSYTTVTSVTIMLVIWVVENLSLTHP